MERRENQEKPSSIWHGLLNLIKSTVAFESLKRITISRSIDSVDDQVPVLTDNLLLHGSKGKASSGTDVEVEKINDLDLMILPQEKEGGPNSSKQIPVDEEIRILNERNIPLEQPGQIYPDVNERSQLLNKRQIEILRGSIKEPTANVASRKTGPTS